ncbi:MAG: hypothetical protein ABEL04_11235 [Salinibacter sp.]|uniref:hypothetical protein n=1 Tax=Salinibacter sp. TaxID=2065818 RepID=UPI0035D4E8DA
MRSVLRSVPIALAAAVLVGVMGPSLAHAQLRYGLFWDPALSSEAGAENLATLHRGLADLKNRVLPHRWTDEETFGKKVLGIAYRAGRSALLDGTVAYLSALTQHEVFGHGAAARHAGIYGTRYEIRLPPPYGPGGGLADYPTGARFRLHEDLHASAGGMNGTLQLARTVRDRAVLRGRLYYDEALLSVAGHLDLPTYVWRTSQDPSVINDVASYLSSLQNSSGSFSAPTLRSLKRRALVSLIDPFSLLALHSYLVHYLGRGKSSSPLPMIGGGAVRYLPSVHLSLSPFGSEVLLEHLVEHDGRLWRVSTRLGDGPHGRFGGAGLKVTNVVRTERLRTSLRLDLWYQPSLLLSGAFRRARPPPNRASGVDPFALGGRAEMSASIRPTAEWPVFVAGTLGYKTDGFVLGEGLDEGLLVEIGLRLDAGLLE